MLEKERAIFKREFIKHYNISDKEKLSEIIDNVSIIIRDENYDYLGLCSYIKNEINLREDSLECIYHELLHRMSIKKFNSGYAGLESYKRIHIGYGLNEGYTEKLTEEMFKDYIEDSYCYDGYYIEKNLATIIENVIGKNKMKLLYFNSGFNVFVKLLSKYLDRKDVLYLLCDIDKYYEILKLYRGKKDIPNIIKKKIYLIESEIYYRLIKLYTNYLNNNRDNIKQELESINEYINNEIFMIYDVKTKKMK